MHRHDRGDAAVGPSIVRVTVLEHGLLENEVARFLGVEIVVLVAIHEHGVGVDVPHGIDRRDECDGGHNDLIAGRDARDSQCDVQGGGAGGASHGVFRSRELTGLLFEAVNKLTGGRDPTGVKAFLDVRPLVSLDDRNAERNETVGRIRHS